MSKTIIFISGWNVPKFVAKSKLIWEEDFWNEYNCVWVSSKTPTSDLMVERELDRLQRLLGRFPGATVAGQSLGAWWGAHLAHRPQVVINKLVCWTPLYHADDYPIFNITPRYSLSYKRITENSGSSKVLTVLAKEDMIVPPMRHAYQLKEHFQGMGIVLDGGHLFQSNHKEGLIFMKKWIES